MDNLLYDVEFDAYAADLLTPAPAKKAQPAGKGKASAALEPWAFAAWFSDLSLADLLGLGLATGLLLASPLLLLMLRPGVFGSVQLIALNLSVPILWWTRHRLRWDLLFRLAMAPTFLGGDVVLVGYLTDQSAFVDGLCVLPQGIAALLALVGLGVRHGSRRAVAEGLTVLLFGSIGNVAAMMMASIVLTFAGGAVVP